MRNGIIVKASTNAGTKVNGTDELVDVTHTLTFAANDYIEIQLQALFAGSGSWLGNELNVIKRY